MEIPLQAQVECTDGVCGHSAYVLIDPVMDQVKHLVVRETSAPQTEYIAPVDLVSASVAGTIQLRCSQAELEKMDRFVQRRFVEEKVPDYEGNPWTWNKTGYYWPYVYPETTVNAPVENRQIPLNEMAVQRGTRVEATDGFVGHVDEFVVNSEHDHITHLVMRKGHLWGQKDVIIPVSAMGGTREDTVLLKLDKHQIESLPTFPVRRRWP